VSETGLFHVLFTLAKGLSKNPRRYRPSGVSIFPNLKASFHKNKNPQPSLRAFVPETGFEPAHRFRRYHLKVVRLPISPPGQFFCVDKSFEGMQK
jgi:hypothetical protein